MIVNIEEHKVLDPDVIAEIEKMYGMDKPAHQRFLKMLKII